MSAPLAQARREVRDATEDPLGLGGAAALHDLVAVALDEHDVEGVSRQCGQSLGVGRGRGVGGVGVERAAVERAAVGDAGVDAAARVARAAAWGELLRGLGAAGDGGHDGEEGEREGTHAESESTACARPWSGRGSRGSGRRCLKVCRAAVRSIHRMALGHGHRGGGVDGASPGHAWTAPESGSTARVDEARSAARARRGTTCELAQRFAILSLMRCRPRA